jgi:hypothetical protein
VNPFLCFSKDNPLSTGFVNPFLCKRRFIPKSGIYFNKKGGDRREAYTKSTFAPFCESIFEKEKTKREDNFFTTKTQFFFKESNLKK